MTKHKKTSTNDTTNKAIDTTKPLSTKKAREEITGVKEEEKPHTQGQKVNAKIRGEKV